MTQVAFGAEPTPVTFLQQTFGGEHHEIYLAVVKERCDADGLDCTDGKVVSTQFRLHLHCGIGYLATPSSIRGVDDLVRLVRSSST